MRFTRGSAIWLVTDSLSPLDFSGEDPLLNPEIVFPRDHTLLTRVNLKAFSFFIWTLEFPFQSSLCSKPRFLVSSTALHSLVSLLRIS